MNNKFTSKDRSLCFCSVVSSFSCNETIYSLLSFQYNARCLKNIAKYRYYSPRNWGGVAWIPAEWTWVRNLAGLSFDFLSCEMPLIFISRAKWAFKELLKRVPGSCKYAFVPNCFSRVWLHATPWTVAHQDPLSLEFSRQPLEWVAMPSSRGSSCTAYISALASGFFTISATWEVLMQVDAQ